VNSDYWPKEHVNFLCRHCGTRSISEAIATEYWRERDERGADTDYRYRLVKCTACGDVSLLLAMQVGYSGEIEVYEDDYAVYPAPPRILSVAVPKTLRACFEEARACYQVRAYTASAIMCRRALELLAIERGVRECNLAQSVTKLKEQGDIDQRLYDWCDALRLAGNEAAHEVGQGVPQADAKDMNDLAEAIIDYVYVFQARYEEFMKRRGTRL
jgi:hypothetical protein